MTLNQLRGSLVTFSCSQNLFYSSSEHIVQNTFLLIAKLIANLIVTVRYRTCKYYLKSLRRKSLAEYPPVVCSNVWRCGQYGLIVCPAPLVPLVQLSAVLLEPLPNHVVDGMRNVGNIQIEFKFILQFRK